MTTSQRTIEVRGLTVEIVRRTIKHLHVGVYPPHGRVRVAAPMRLQDEALRLAVVSRLGWIRRQQQAFAAQDRQSQREMVTGESHYFQGRRYLLDVIEEDEVPFVRLANRRTIALRVRPESDRQARELVLDRWYRRQLRDRIAPLLAKWQPRVGKTVAEVWIKKMKTLWGSCNARARRIWLNLELVKKPPSCLEYILVHEMVHLLERHHDDRFQERMGKLMPSWRLLRDELNRAPLAHQEWDY